ncbi:MAG: ABC transporter permease [Candidatus Thermoplasmatota archaeon]|nr:ABC transporter permease [Candidatus Thermoplasmatota archaeon]
MQAAEFQAIYVMWLRQMKRFIRSKSRLASTIVQPLFFLLILGSGFRAATFEGIDDYLSFLAPGIVTMAILFSSMFTGISVLWDKQFGFLQEVLVAPISRFSIIIGRTLGGATVALIQGVIILLISLGLGVKISGAFGLLLTLVFMILIAFTSVGFGLVIASKMEDFQGFQLIMSLLIMPLLFLSSAFFPVTANPTMKTIAIFNPLFYMVDGLRGSLVVDVATVHHPLFDLLVVVVMCIIMMGAGSYLFSKSEV